MTAERDDRIKQAYAYGSSIALAELGFESEEATQMATKLASEAVAPADARLQAAYAQGVERAKKEAGLVPQD